MKSKHDEITIIMVMFMAMVMCFTPCRLTHLAVTHFQTEISNIRSGRANPGLVEPVVVELASGKVALKDIASIVARNAQLLAVTVYNIAVSAQMPRLGAICT